MRSQLVTASVPWYPHDTGKDYSVYTTRQATAPMDAALALPDGRSLFVAPETQPPGYANRAMRQS